MGQFLGFSDEHSSLVVNVRNLSTGYISPQFHLVFGDLFETVVCLGEDDIVFDARHRYYSIYRGKLMPYAIYLIL